MADVRQTLIAGGGRSAVRIRAGLRVAGWRGSLPLGGAVCGQAAAPPAGSADLWPIGLAGRAELGGWARAARDAGHFWDASPC